MDAENTLIVITGPTGSGKTALAIRLAQQLGCDIISADSRQLFRDIPICTAAPTPEELAAAKHHFVGILGLEDYYSAAMFEEQVMALLPGLFARNRYVVMCGGSMLYVDAVVKGIDDIPTISPWVRNDVMRLYSEQGLEAVRRQLEALDPEYLRTADLCNTRRMLHALEICLQGGRPYSELRTGVAKERPFKVLKYALQMPREVLFSRINRRVESMVAQGLEQEARSVYHLRHLNSLNTVGMKEMFAWFDGTMDFPTAVARMQKNTRVFAKKQLTWLAKDPDVRFLDAAADPLNSILADLQPPVGNIGSR